MKLGVINNETWSFFHEIFEEFRSHHETTLYQTQSLSVPLFQDRLQRITDSRRLKRFLMDHDVVFFEWASELLAKATQLPKVCAIVTRLHRYELYHWADQINWDAVDRIILVSDAKKRELLSRFPQQEEKIEIVPEAISPDRFTPHEKEYSGDIGILCHLSPRKRVYELILTFRELLKRGGQYRLHVGGAGHGRYPDYEPAVRSLVARLGLEEHVKFYGAVSNPAQWYRNVDVYVSNSYSEGLQVSPMEAIASGSYCVSHWWDGADELLPEGDLYFTDRELIDLIEAYNDLSPTRQAALRSRQHAIVSDRFNIEVTSARIREIVEQSVSGKTMADKRQ